MNDAQSILEAWRQDDPDGPERRYVIRSPFGNGPFEVQLYCISSLKPAEARDTSATVAAQLAIKQMEGMK
jgi:hypothetical protein